MDKMTVTRALAELKLLGSRIEKEIGAANFVAIYQNRADVIVPFGGTKAEFEKSAKAAHQRITDLIARHRRIKSAVLTSNARTSVKIGKSEYSVTEAIARKNSIEHEKMLLEKMKAQHGKCAADMENHRVNLDSRVEALLKQNLGVDKKADAGTWDAIAKPFIEQNETRMADPIGIRDKIDALDRDIDEFLKDVDFTLSESNARTEIEI